MSLVHPAQSETQTLRKPKQQKEVKIHAKKKRVKDKDINCDIFEEHRFIESPRRVIREKTLFQAKSTLALHLEAFYEEVVLISESKLDRLKTRCQEVRDYIYPRIKRLGNQFGINVQKLSYTGSFTDGTMVAKGTEVDMFLIFDCHKAKVVSKKSGYYQIPLKTYREDKEDSTDQFRFGRSENGRYLSVLEVTRSVYDLIGRAIKLNNRLELLPFVLDDGAAHIRVKAKRFILNIIPAISTDKGSCYIHTRPYTFDIHLTDDEHWRVSYIEREKEILEMMDSADRGGRTKAFKILKAMTKTEPALKGISTYHLKTILLHNFDSDVDNTARWQREQLEMCFRAMLQQLHHALKTNSLPHFFIERFDLFHNIPTRLLNNLQARITYMITHENDIFRILKKR